MIGVIADDLTGAAELGAVGLRHGFHAELLLAGASPSGEADLVCVDIDSRACEAGEAARRAAGAAALLVAHGAKWIYKKSDSVLRGNVAREIEAILGQLRLSCALLIPANPSLGRTMARGRCRIHGVPVHETDFRRDPGHPRVSDVVLEMLDRPLVMTVSIGGPEGELPETGIHVGEAATTADVLAWAARDTRGHLLAGGADFFAALLGSRGIGATHPVPATKELFVCGSASESTSTFVASQAKSGVPTFAVAGNPAGSEMLVERIRGAFFNHARVILHGGFAVIDRDARAASRMNHLVRIAAGVLRTCDVPHVYAEGGATAAALAQEMDWRLLRVRSELAPGVVTAATRGNPYRLLTIKPGSYAWPVPR
jgi:uncharacterized protein YgbK (DUF1537 family)